MSFRVTVPATTANLGPGFDCLGLALSVYNEIEVRSSDRFNLRIEGEGAGRLAPGPGNLIWRTFAEFYSSLGSDLAPYEVVCRNRIPLARGMGSSAAALIGALAAANHAAGSPRTHQEILDWAVREEGHPDNVAPALLGGMVVCGRDGDRTVTKRIEPPAGLKIVLLIPERTLKTSEARRVVPTSVSISDAVSNLQNTALVATAFTTGDWELLRSGFVDRIHEPYRAGLMPGFLEVQRAAREAGAYGAPLSGAGPTVIAFCPAGQEQGVGEAMKLAFEESGSGECRVMDAEIDLAGTRIEELG